MQTATRTLPHQKGIAEEAVLKYLTKNRRLSLNTSYLSHPVVFDGHAKQILLIQSSFVGLADLMHTLREYNRLWEEVSYEVQCQFSLEWDVLPWIFIYGPLNDILVADLRKLKPKFGYCITQLHDI
jgi:hypothetical protein